jgi:hypothetical protein
MAHNITCIRFTRFGFNILDILRTFLWILDLLWQLWGLLAGLKKADVWAADGWAADGWAADGWATDGRAADGWAADG